MSPTLATALTLFGVLYLLRRDARQGETSSSALWLPVMWLGITFSLRVAMARPERRQRGQLHRRQPDRALYFATLIGAALTLQTPRFTFGRGCPGNGWCSH